MKNILIIVRLTKKQFENDIKYKGIVKAFKNLGLHVWYTYTEDEKIYITDGLQVIEIGEYGILKQRFMQYMYLFKAVKRYIKEVNGKFDYCYVRHMPALWGLKSLLKLISRRGAKIAVEIPTYPGTGERKSETFARKVALAISDYNNDKASKYVDVYLPMGEDATTINNRPAVNIRNGIDVETIMLRKRNREKSGEIHLIAIGKIARWHGYSRIVEGLRIYYNNNPLKKVFLHVVGPEGDGSLARLQKLVEEYKLSEYVIFEGPKFGDEANEFFDKSDIAISSLGIKGIKKMYPIKIVEFLARGIPFIYTKEQCGAKTEWEFCKCVSSDDSPLDINEVVAFAEEMRSRDGLPEKMREIAQKECSWEIEMKKMLDFFAEER